MSELATIARILCEILLYLMVTSASERASIAVEMSVVEESPAGTIVGLLDARTSYSYTFQEPTDIFEVSRSGAVRTVQVIDREALPSPVIRLSLIGNPNQRHSRQLTYSLVITVLDINDNIPVFHAYGGREKISFQEDVREGRKSIAIATDRDDGANGLVDEYNIVSGNEAGMFGIDLSGLPLILYIVKQRMKDFDRELLDHYRLNISARDSGTPPRYGFLVVDVVILDVNDNAPSFELNEFISRLNESAPIATPVFLAQASDSDLGLNGEIIYRLEDGTHQFGIDENTGFVRTMTSPLRCSRRCERSSVRCTPNSCSVLIEASDKGLNALVGRTFLYIEVLDENDHDPVIVFSRDGILVTSASVSENAGNQTSVFSIGVSDQDKGVNGETALQIINGNEGGYFFHLSLPSYGFNEFQVARQLDREAIDTFNLTFEAVDKGKPPRRSTANIIITVTDANDHRPEFEHLSYRASLSEFTHPHSFVAIIRATDKDQGVNSQLTYQMEAHGQGIRWFSIESNTGLVTTTDYLDHEELSQVVLNITVHDSGSDPKSSYTSLTIDILDENDNTPQFSQATYAPELMENSPSGTAIITLETIDLDSEDSGAVEYFVHYDTKMRYPNAFDVNPTTGAVRALQSFDREMTSEYVIKIVAKDKGKTPLSATAIVELTITDANDNRPKFSPKEYFVNVMVNDPVGHQVVVVHATDGDSGLFGHVIYSLTDPCKSFQINAHSGAISTHLKMTHEKCRLIVRATDRGGLQADDDAIVNVIIISTSINSHSWSWQSQNYVIIEDNGELMLHVGRLVGRVETPLATDGALTYSIVGGDANGIFNIDSTGTIRTQSAVDREARSIYNLTVVAYDGAKISTSLAIVTVRDLNDNAPVFICRTTEVTILENWPVGRYIFLAKAVDADNNQDISYSMTSSNNTNGVFACDNFSGLIYLTKSPNHLSDSLITLIVTATDTGIPRRSTSLSLTIRIEDVNDHTPVFSSSSYDLLLPESQPVNDIVMVMSALDSDKGRNGAIWYAILRGNVDRRFGMFPDGSLFVARELDREQEDMYILTIVVKDSGANPRSSSVNLTIFVEDENDNKPVFMEEVYEFVIKENRSPGTLVGAVKAVDNDDGRNSHILYFLLGDSGNVSIDHSTGSIFLKYQLDREVLVKATNRAYFVLEVIAIDNGLEPNQNKVSVKVTVQDENDNPPVFMHAPGTVISISEHSGINDVVFTLLATDADDLANSAVSYSIVGGNDDIQFGIHSALGQLYLKEKLNREVKDQYLLKITASDGGEDVHLETSIYLQVHVLDYNDNVPYFSPETLNSLTVSEDTPTGETLITFSGSDADQDNNGRLRYDIISGNEDIFALDVYSGKLSLIQSLDFESAILTKGEHVLNISISDSGFPSLSVAILLTVKVTDVNDNSPAFTDGLSKVYAKENKLQGSRIADVSAFDKDSGDLGRIKYTIFQQKPVGNYFAINEVTGEITVSTNLDREQVDAFKVIIHATDQDSVVTQRRTAEKSLSIFVEDVNDNFPVFQSSNVFLVPSSSPPGSAVATVWATDSDYGNNSNIYYSLSGLKSTLVRLDQLTGKIYLAQDFPMNVHNHTLTITATDCGEDDIIGSKSTTMSAIILVYINDGQGPSFSMLNPTSGRVMENVVPGASILRVIATPCPTCSPVEYYVINVTTSGRACGGLFSVDHTTGEILTLAPVDREQLPGDVFQVYVCAVHVDHDGHLHATTTQVSIKVEDKNDNAPLFSSTLFKASVSEFVSPGSAIAWIHVTDQDITGSLALSLAGDDSNKFGILQNGTLYVKQILDHEDKSSHNFSVVAADGVTESTALIYVTVVDENDNWPVFSEPCYYFDVPENAEIGSTVGRILATDADSGSNGHVVYEYVSQWGHDDFLLETKLGAFVLKRRLDYEEQQLYVLSVMARDEAAISKVTEIKVYVNVKDVNDNPPKFDNVTYTGAITHDSPAGTVVVTVTATDLDLGLNGNIRYSLHGHPTSKFRIGPINGSVYTIGRLDKDNLPVYIFVVMATDQASEVKDRMSATATIEVKLLNVEERSLIFLSPDLTEVKENVKIGSKIHTVVVQEQILGVNKQVSFRLLSHSGHGNVVSIDATSGVIVLISQLDRETVPSYTLVIEATVNGASSVSAQQILVIKVVDNNDNAPKFSQKLYKKTVFEDVSLGTILLRVKATDLDDAFNGAVRYFLADGNGSQYFHLDMYSGVLRVQKPLDYERAQAYSLVVQAVDNSLENPLHSNTTIIITIVDVNDCEPVFDDSPYEAFVQEGMHDEPVLLANVRASDDDSGDNGLVQYMLRDINSKSHTFQVDSATGEIFVLKSLDRESMSVYVLILVAIDKGNPVRIGTATVTVFVMDINDHAPVFDNLSLHQVHVSENQPPGTGVVNISATDEDDGVNSQIIYSLLDNVSNKFTILPHSGRIQTTALLDRELVPLHYLTVVATDMGLPPKSSSAQVIILVDDDNDHAPEFKDSIYEATLGGCQNIVNFVVGVMAVDQDTGDNGKVIYTLESYDESYFQINRETGVVTLAKAFKQLTWTQTRFTFVVRASDLGLHPMSSTASVVVNVSNTTSTNCPKFRYISSSPRIQENAKFGSEVTTVQVKAGSRVTYHIAGGNVNNVFVVNPESGSITVAGMIDYELIQTYSLWLEARVKSSSHLSSFYQLTVIVVDENDNSPVFSSSLFTAEIDENCPVGTPVLQVIASDLDSGNNQQILYIIKSGNENNTFVVNSSSGQVTTINPTVDREKIAFFHLEIEASDMGLLKQSATTTVRIIIRDTNDNQPTFIGTRSVAVPENLPKDSLIMQLTTNDLDIGNNAQVTFSFEKTFDKSFPFTIDAQSGNIINVHELDAETESRYSFRVTATDGAFIQKTILIIRVLDVNDNPPKFQNSVLLFNFTEKQPTNTKVAHLSALDLDKSSPNNMFYFSLKHPSSLFELDSETGELIALETMYFFQKPTEVKNINDYTLHVLVTDLGVPSLSSAATLVIHISDANDHAPVFKNTHYLSAVPVNFPLFTRIIQVIAEDDMDVGKNADVTYEVISGSGMSLFSINATSGDIYSNSSLKGNDNHKFSLVVNARDNGFPVMSSITNVELYVTEINVSPPRFNNNNFFQQVSEDVAEGYVIDTIMATDTDKGLNGEIIYNITTGNYGDLFSIGASDGVLKVTGKLDFETKASYLVSVTAKDKAYFYKEVSKDYKISLLDANDHKPLFVQDYYDAYIKENSQPNSLVVTVSATDADTSYRNAEICYSISEETDSRIFFKINEKTGAVTSSNVIFDFEQRTLYTLIVLAFNPGKDNCESPVLTSVTTVFVHVVGENEHTPQFIHQNYTLEVSEAVEVGTSLERVQAVDNDADLDGIIFYYLEGESNLMGFSLEHVTGILRVSKRPDFESSPHIVLTVIAKNWGSVFDNNTDTCTINIFVSDANDPPEFSRSVYHANISENSKVHTFVVNVHADDEDLKPENQDFSYEIISGNEYGEFEVSPSGRVQTSGLGVLDRESKDRHVLVVGARDPYNPKIVGLTTLEIQLVDVNDNGPRWSREDCQVNITENAPPGQEVILLKDFIMDYDLPPNQGPYSYKIMPGFWTDFFSIDKMTGCVRTKQVLNSETHPNFIVSIVVTDNGRPRLTSTLSLTVSVMDIPSPLPKPKLPRIIISRLENERRYDKIADISPWRSGSRNRFNCRILDFNDSPFFISQGCSLGIVGDLPASTYNLKIQGSDSKLPPTEYNVTVAVETITNKTLVNSVAVVLREEQVSSFLEKKYFIFTHQIQDAFGTHFKCKIYSLKQVGRHLYVMLYVFDTEQGFLSWQDIKRGLNNAKAVIEIRANISIETVAASLCDVNPCRNAGKCFTTILLSGGTSIFESSSLILNVPNTDLGTSCLCSQSYTGPTCEKQQELCGNNYCKHGGVCINGTCQCPNQWTGRFCEMDINECQTVAPCMNGAVCQNIKGSFKCHCSQGYQGPYCDSRSFCSHNLCSEHGTCKELHDSFHCICDYGYYGATCHLSSVSFHKGAYAQFRSVDTSDIYNITMYFATVETNALLLFSSLTIADVEAGFLAIEIVNSQIKVSFLMKPPRNIHTLQEISMTTTDPVINGDWHRLEFTKAFGIAKLLVLNCPDSTCEPCSDHRPDCYSETTYEAENDTVQVKYISVGGIKDFHDILKLRGRISTHDFQGCLHSVVINGESLVMSGLQEGDNSSLVADMHNVVATCPRRQSRDSCRDRKLVCHNNGVCVDKWFHVTCKCPSDYMDDVCLIKKQPFSLKSNAVIKYTLRPSYVRDQQLSAVVSETSRKQRSLGDTSVTVRLRTKSDHGVVMSLTTESVSCMVWLTDKKVHFMLKSNDSRDDTLAVESAVIADGSWHNVSVRGSGTIWKLDVDGQNAITRDFAHTLDFGSPDIAEMVIGGRASLPDSLDIEGFNGCLSQFLINGELIPLNGSSEKYEIQISGDVEATCEALCEDNPCGGDNTCLVDGESYQCLLVDVTPVGLEKGFLAVLVLFVLLVTFIVVLFVLFHMHRNLFYMCGLNKKQSHGSVDRVSKGRSLGADIPAGNSNSFIMSPHAAGPHEEKVTIHKHITENILGKGASSHTALCHLTDSGEPHETQNLLEGDLAMQTDTSNSLIEEALILQHYRFENSSSPVFTDIFNYNIAKHRHLSTRHHHHHYQQHFCQQQPQANSRLFKTSKYNLKSHGASKYRVVSNTESPIDHIKQSTRFTKGTALQVYAKHNSMPAENSKCLSSVLEAANLTEELCNCPSLQTHLNVPNTKKYSHILRSSYSNNINPKDSTSYTDSYQGPSCDSQTRIPASAINLSTQSLSKLVHNKSSSLYKNCMLKRTDVKDASRACSHSDLIHQTNSIHLASSQFGSHPRLDNHPGLHKTPELDNFIGLELSKPSSDESGKSDSFTCSEFEYEIDTGRSQFEVDERQIMFPKLATTDNANEDNIPFVVNKEIKASSSLDALSLQGNSGLCTDVASSRSEYNQLQQPFISGYNIDSLLFLEPSFNRMAGVFMDIGHLPETGQDPVCSNQKRL